MSIRRIGCGIPVVLLVSVITALDRWFYAKYTFFAIYHSTAERIHSLHQ